jgi:hypothetical protein
MKSQPQQIDAVMLTLRKLPGSPLDENFMSDLSALLRVNSAVIRIHHRASMLDDELSDARKVADVPEWANDLGADEIYKGTEAMHNEVMSQLGTVLRQSGVVIRLAAQAR